MPPNQPRTVVDAATALTIKETSDGTIMIFGLDNVPTKQLVTLQALLGLWKYGLVEAPDDQQPDQES